MQIFLILYIIIIDSTLQYDQMIFQRHCDQDQLREDQGSECHWPDFHVPKNRSLTTASFQFMAEMFWLTTSQSISSTTRQPCCRLFCQSIPSIWSLLLLHLPEHQMVSNLSWMEVLSGAYELRCEWLIHLSQKESSLFPPYQGICAKQVCSFKQFFLTGTRSIHSQ